MQKITNYIDFNFNLPLLFAIISALLVIPCYLFLPEHFGYENCLIENIQMVILLLCFIFSIKAKNSKTFFYIISLFIIIFALREINCGRVFFPIPGKVNAFYHWEDIKYGFIVGPIYESFIAFSCILVLVKKAYKTLFLMLTNTRLPIWNILFFIAGIILSSYADKHISSYVFEEMTELVMYVSVCGLIYMYAFNEDKNIEYFEKGK